MAVRLHTTQPSVHPIVQYTRPGVRAEKVALQKIDPRSGDVYRLAKQMRRDNQDVMGENLLRTMQANSR